MTDYFTADPHFYHDKIRKLCKRPFDDVQTMNDTIIQNINNKVTPQDRLFILGDFCFGDMPAWKECLKRINTNNVWFIPGNHDKVNYKQCGFAHITPYYELKTWYNKQPQKIVLFHYPILEWNGWFRDSWHLHGHTHGNIPFVKNQYRLDVGVDVHNFSPVSLDDIWTNYFSKVKRDISNDNI